MKFNFYIISVQDGNKRIIGRWFKVMNIIKISEEIRKACSYKSK